MNTKEYPIRIARGHILVTDDRGTTLLIDTGSPLSFHSDKVISLCGETISAPSSLMGVDDAYLSDKVGEQVDGLVGMNIIGPNGLLIDVPNGKAVFGCPTDGMTNVPSQLRMGYMTIEMTIRDGRRANVIVDTGAPTSYMSPSLTEGLPSVDTVEDFNPLVPGDIFETPIFEFPATFAGQTFTMRAGHLPKLLQASLSLIGVDGVIGMELLQRQPILFASNGVWV